MIKKSLALPTPLSVSSTRMTVAPRLLVRSIVLLVMVVVVAGCKPSSTPKDSGPFAGEYPIQAVTTVGMVADLVRNVGGEHVAVDQICGSGVDPHLFKATRDDMQAIMAGDIVFYCGLMLEGKMSDTLVKIARKKPVIAVAAMIDKSILIAPEGFDGHPDPHVWNDVSAWAQCVAAVEKTLADFDPKHAADYQANAQAYRDQLAKLHQYGVKSVATVPEGRRLLVTSHDAFNYFGKAYGIEVQGVQGLSTESEAGVQRINELVDTLVDRKVKAVFIESSVSRKNIDALIEGARSRGHDVVVGGELYSDAMGAKGTFEGTYIGMLDHNMTTVTRALGGTADAKGFSGKLSVDTNSDE